MSVSPAWFKCQYMQELALMSQITVAHHILTYNKEDLNTVQAEARYCAS